MVKAHKITKVYATVLATVKKNVDVFQLVSCDNHLRVDIKRGGEAQELHSKPAAQQQSKEKGQLQKVKPSVRNRMPQPTTARIERREERTCDVLRKARGGMQVIQRTCSRRIVTQGRGVMKIGPKLLEWPQRVGSGA